MRPTPYSWRAKSVHSQARSASATPGPALPRCYSPARRAAISGDASRISDDTSAVVSIASTAPARAAARSAPNTASVNPAIADELQALPAMRASSGGLYEASKAVEAIHFKVDFRRTLEPAVRGWLRQAT